MSGLVTLLDEERKGWAALALAAYKAGQNKLGHDFSVASNLPSGFQMDASRHKRFMAIYRAWRATGELPTPKPPAEPSRIEKSALRRGQYVGYNDGAWRIKHTGIVWTAIKQTPPHDVLTATSLQKLNAKLAAWKARNPNPAYLAGRGRWGIFIQEGEDWLQFDGQDFSTKDPEKFESAQAARVRIRQLRNRYPALRKRELHVDVIQ